MYPIVLGVAVAAALGVALVVYGIVSQGRAAMPVATRAGGARVSYRTLADVREQLRRRFEPTGSPVWIAANQNVSSLAADLVSADLQLRPYEFRILQAISAFVFAVIGFLRFGVNLAVVVLAVLGYVLPSIYLHNRRGHRTRMFEAGLPRAMGY